MTARNGMVNLIAELRGATAAGTADYAIGAQTYWSDDHLQQQLDHTRVDLTQVPLEMIPTLENQVINYTLYAIPPLLQWFEEQVSSGNTFYVRDVQGYAVGTANYTVNYQSKMITFGTTTGGSALYLDCRAFDLNAAAAAVWRMKASAAGTKVDWQSDNMRVSSSQESANCLRMADYFESLAGSRVGRFVRSDEV